MADIPGVDTAGRALDIIKPGDTQDPNQQAQRMQLNAADVVGVLEYYQKYGKLPPKLGKNVTLDAFIDSMAALVEKRPEALLGIAARTADTRLGAQGKNMSDRSQMIATQGQTDLDVYSHMLKKAFDGYNNAEVDRVMKENNNRLNILQGVSGGFSLVGTLAPLVMVAGAAFGKPELVAAGQNMLNMAIEASQKLPGIAPTGEIHMQDAYKGIFGVRPNVTSPYDQQVEKTNQAMAKTRDESTRDVDSATDAAEKGGERITRDKFSAHPPKAGVPKADDKAPKAGVGTSRVPQADLEHELGGQATQPKKTEPASASKRIGEADLSRELNGKRVSRNDIDVHGDFRTASANDPSMRGTSGARTMDPGVTFVQVDGQEIKDRQRSTVSANAPIVLPEPKLAMT